MATVIQKVRCEHAWVLPRYPERQARANDDHVVGVCVRCRTRQKESLEKWAEYLETLLLARSNVVVERLVFHFNEHGRTSF